MYLHLVYVHTYEKYMNIWKMKNYQIEQLEKMQKFFKIKKNWKYEERFDNSDFLSGLQ